MWGLPVLQMIPFDDLVDIGVLAEPELPIGSVTNHSNAQEPVELTHMTHFVPSA